MVEHNKITEYNFSYLKNMLGVPLSLGNWNSVGFCLKSNCQHKVAFYIEYVRRSEGLGGSNMPYWRVVFSTEKKLSQPLDLKLLKGSS